MDRQWGPLPEQPWSKVIRWSADDQPAVNAAVHWSGMTSLNCWSRSYRFLAITAALAPPSTRQSHLHLSRTPPRTGRWTNSFKNLPCCCTAMQWVCTATSHRTHSGANPQGVGGDGGRGVFWGGSGIGSLTLWTWASSRRFIGHFWPIFYSQNSVTVLGDDKMS